MPRPSTSRAGPLIELRPGLGLAHGSARRRSSASLHRHLLSHRGCVASTSVLVTQLLPAVLRRQVHRPALQPADRAVLAGLWRLLPRHRQGRCFVQPATLLRWHRDLVTNRWTYLHRRPGRPSPQEPLRSSCGWHGQLRVLVEALARPAQCRAQRPGARAPACRIG
jgi:hypothetical protein